MSKNLVIVESPAKSKTIKKYLGKDFVIMASYGHVRDLLPKKGAVEPDKDFLMHYEIIDRNAKHMKEIRQALKKAQTLYLATDPDREGEAISWHVQQILQEQGALKNRAVHRVVFHEITRNAVQEAVANPRSIDMNLVNAQQTRRALDYLVGFNLSPLLWKKIRRGLSAGRVQSPALRLIVERELEIESFQTREYWSLTALCENKNKSFKAKLVKYNNKKVEQFTVTQDKQAQKIKDELIKTAKGELLVNKVEKKSRKRQPAAPFITSTLQQEAARKLGFTTQRTMRIAQQLYEGIDVGSGSDGLITYMRTDSVNLSKEAVDEIRNFISKQYSDRDVPKQVRLFRTKSKNAQEAHEAIRPTSVKQLPEKIKSFLSAEQYKLYDLIWKRAVACQMVNADFDMVAIDLDCGKKHSFRATGSTLTYPGYMKVYQEGKDDEKEEEGAEVLLPSLKEGEKIELTDVISKQHFTEPPPRYTEASLVKSLEEYGIGRPSTYASIISTLQQREYAILKQKRFYPTDIGKIVNKFLTEYFTKYVDYNFTAKLEDELDAISRGEKTWLPLLKEFWQPFIKLVDHITETVKRSEVTQEQLDELCPKCGEKLSIRLGKNGRFIGCTGYPDCDYTRNLETENETEEAETKIDRLCPKCQSELQIRHGPYGKFIGCTNYPNCKYIESLNKPSDTKVLCPSCHKGTMLKRKSRSGKIFYSCSDYPKCKYATWDEPIAEVCPQCKWPILTIKTTKKRGTEKVCPQKNCDYKEPYEPEEKE